MASMSLGAGPSAAQKTYNPALGEALIDAGRSGDVQKIREMLAANADPNAREYVKYRVRLPSTPLSLSNTHTQSCTHTQHTHTHVQYPHHPPEMIWEKK